jgi:hypothetical protein
MDPKVIREQIKKDQQVPATAVVGDVVIPHDPVTEVEVKKDAPKG